jgi:CRISPR-associated protein Csx3
MKNLRKIAVCGPPHSGKSVFLANLMRQLPPDSFYLAFAAPDGEWHWSNFGDQDLVKVVRQKGKFNENFVSSMVEAIRNNQQPLVLVDTGGVMSSENERIFSVCDGCIILANKESSEEMIPAWQEFATRNGVQVIAELVSDLHGADELSSNEEGEKILGRIAGLERGHTIVSPVLEAVANRLRGIIRANADITEGELLANVNGATLVSRLGVVDQNDPFLGVRPEHLRPALELTRAVSKLPEVKLWNVRAAILACAYVARLPNIVDLYDVNAGYIRIPEVEPAGKGCAGNGVDWEVLELPEFNLVKFKPNRFLTTEDLPRITPPAVSTDKPVTIHHDGPPMWLDATVVRAYARAGAPWVAMTWPVESARPQSHLGGKRWDEVFQFSGPAVVVAGPEEKIGEILPVSFDFLVWDAPVVGKLATGEIVVDRKDSHVASHASALPHIAEALSKIHAKERKSFCETVDLGRSIGANHCVETHERDDIIFAQRPNRAGLTRFVKNRKPDQDSRMTCCLTKVNGGGFILGTAFVGPMAPAEPWDSKFADENSVEFWNSHALVWGYGEVIADTETTRCPW